jgi:hypothetical protein
MNPTYLFGALLCLGLSAAVPVLPRGAYARGTTQLAHGTVEPETLREQARSSLVFDGLVGLRELSDGRVVIIERGRRALFILDSTLRRQRQIGRTGDGPAEYRSPSRILPLHGDSSLVIDATTRRWLLLDGERFVALPNELLGASLQWRGELAGVASRTETLELAGVGSSRRLPIPARGRPEGHEKVAVLLRHGGGAVDTLFTGQTEFHGFASKRGASTGSSMDYYAMHPLQSSDQALLLPQGIVAIMTLRPYRVEWRTQRGALLARIIVQDQLPLLDGRSRDALAAAVVRDPNDRAVFSAADFTEWPERVPPFVSRALLASPDGHLCVQRTRIDEQAAQQVDVFAQRTGRVGSFVVPAGERLLAVGARGVYTRRRTVDDEEILVRYALPATLFR